MPRLWAQHPAGGGLRGDACARPGAHAWPGAKRCAACSAVFPRADQDAAVQRAAEARIQSALDEIEIRERIRPKSFWKRLFG